MKSKFAQGLKKFVLYAVGLVLIAVGINCSKLSSLGISPVSSVPRACEVIWGWSLGAMTIMVYCVLVLLQIAVLRRRFKWTNLLGIPVAVAFGFLVDLFGVTVKTNFFGIDTSGFGHWLAWLPAPENYAARIGYFVASLVIIALGVFLYLRPKWVPMPAEGFAAAIAEVSGMKFGNCKTIVDSSMITIAFIMHFVFMVFIKGMPVGEFFKGFIGLPMNFEGAVVVVGIGTVLSAVLIGQLVKFFMKTWSKIAEKGGKTTENEAGKAAEEAAGEAVEEALEKEKKLEDEAAILTEDAGTATENVFENAAESEAATEDEGFGEDSDGE